MKKITTHIKELDSMKRYPVNLYYNGQIDILKRPKVSIVGTRRPSTYTRQQSFDIAKALSTRGVVVVSGAAMGVDAIVHTGAGADNTIAVLATGIDIRYPAVNRNLIADIESRGLTISQFDIGFRATAWSFVLRNELVVALGDILVVTEADIDSGSMRSVEYAIAMGKEIFVLTHQIGDSMGTNELLRKGLAKPIYDIEDFASLFGDSTKSTADRDEFYYFCQKHPTLDSAIEHFGHRVYEAELEGIIAIDGGIIRVV